jgi:uncharacterized protein YutE (UPF0331/DUF86 family)
MNRKRIQRYKQKINIIIEKGHDIPEHPVSSLEIDATLYRIQVAIEASMDVIAMLVKDSGREVTDDYGNIHTLQKQKILSKALADSLATLNGLRNAILHKYNTFEEATVIDGLEEIRETVSAFIEKANHEITKHTATQKRSKGN